MAYGTLSMSYLLLWPFLSCLSESDKEGMQIYFIDGHIDFS